MKNNSKTKYNFLHNQRKEIAISLFLIVASFMAFKEMRIAKSLGAGSQRKKIVKEINREQLKITGHQ